MKTCVLVSAIVCVASAGALAGPASTKPRPQTGNGIEAAGSAGWPAVAARLAKQMARDSLAHDYASVWDRLDPVDRQATSQARWEACQRAHPAAPPTITITRVAVAQANQLPVALPLLGRVNVQEIQLYVQYTTPGLAQPQAAVLSTFWRKQGKVWTAVWLGDEYDAYKAGRCYLTPQGSPLY